MSGIAEPPRLGVLVNPVAGIGATAGMHGSDGAAIQASARERGGRPRAGPAMVTALDGLPAAWIITPPGAMGADWVAAAGLSAAVLRYRLSEPTTAADTRACVAALVTAGVRALVFAGGDGTARDVCAAVPEGLPVLGVPGGVKMHSGVFAHSARAASEVLGALVSGRVRSFEYRDVVDLDEHARRVGRLHVSVFGRLLVPLLAHRVQPGKLGSGGWPLGSAWGCAEEVAARLRPRVRYALGPGSTIAEVAARLGISGSLLGVDVIEDGRVIATDASERELLELLRAGDVVVVSPIGGQGFLFGRGNQQISARVLRQVGRAGVLCLMPETKLASLGGRPLLVDTGDDPTDQALSGYLRCVSGRGQEVAYPVRVA